MFFTRNPVAEFVLGLAICFGTLPATWAQTSEPTSPHAASPGAVARPVGTIKAINGSTITLATDAGAGVSVIVQDATRLVRTAPGQTTLKDAMPIRLQDLQIGDRMLVRGTLAGNNSVIASSAIVMKQSDIATRQQQQQQDWQKRGVGGLVKSVDAVSGSIVISMASFASTKTVTLHTSKSTVIRRYSPDSVKFDDASAGTLDQIKPGDQLRARGNRNPDGSELDAEEIVSGSFRNIAGTVSSTDASQSTISGMDLISKKPFTVKLRADSQLRQLPQAFAQRIAVRLKGGSNGGPPVPPAAAAGAGQGTEGRRATSSDFQQILSRLPPVAITDIHKGDAVLIVATEGSANSEPTAITLLSGVEPILTAAPSSSSAATLLSPWNLGSSPAGDAASQ